MTTYTQAQSTELEQLYRSREQLQKDLAELEARERAIEDEATGKNLWPKRLAVLVSGDEWDYDTMQFIEKTCGFERDGNKYRNFKNIGYETELYFDVYENGSYKLVGVEGHNSVTFGDTDCYEDHLNGLIAKNNRKAK